MSAGNMISAAMPIFHVVRQEDLKSGLFLNLKSVNFYGTQSVFSYVPIKIRRMAEYSTRWLITGYLLLLHVGPSYVT
jgi:hypothetical protein